MKKAALIAAVLLVSAGLSPAQTWEVGISGGYRTIKDEALRTAYGNGLVFTPYLSLEISKALRVGAEYEFGYVKDAAIGIFQDRSTLDVAGGHVFLQYGERKGRLLPFLKVGVGLFFYRFDVAIPGLSGLNISDNDISFYFGAGLRYSLAKRIFATAELKYAALWVDPFDDLVDLGGIRALLGIAFGI
ncbi:MAG: outer membrane beta-barrel protein [Candidatus Aminicenantes bacterium]|nr:outer membrane beta-barrel protein [Candidatus Aminicenantes bacterium]